MELMALITYLLFEGVVFLLQILNVFRNTTELLFLFYSAFFGRGSILHESVEKHA